MACAASYINKNLRFAMIYFTLQHYIQFPTENKEYLLHIIHEREPLPLYLL